MEVFCRPESSVNPRVPLLVIYSSELEENHLAFWFYCMRSELAQTVDYIVSMIAQEKWILAPLSFQVWRVIAAA